jgi:hypothetical protein
MNRWQLPHLYALLQSQDAGDWQWQSAEDRADGTRCWVLVQKTAEGDLRDCGVYALGDQLTLQARVLAMVTPAVLLDVSERALRVEDARERLQHLESVIRRCLSRAYHRQDKANYADFRWALSESVVVSKLLAASRPPPLQELEVWEREALDASEPPMSE